MFPMIKRVRWELRSKIITPVELSSAFHTACFLDLIVGTSLLCNRSSMVLSIHLTKNSENHCSTPCYIQIYITCSAWYKSVRQNIEKSPWEKAGREIILAPASAWQMEPHTTTVIKQFPLSEGVDPQIIERSNSLDKHWMEPSIQRSSNTSNGRLQQGLKSQCPKDHLIDLQSPAVKYASTSDVDAIYLIRA